MKMVLNLRILKKLFLLIFTLPLINFNIKSQTPYGGIVRNIPGVIQAEDYDMGGQSVAYYDLSSGNNTEQYRSDDVDISECIEGGYKVRDWQAGEWMIYSVNATAGTYDLKVRVGTAAPNLRIKILLDGVLLTTFTLPNTGDNNAFQTITASNISITGGTNKKLKIESVDGGVYLNWFEFVSASSTPAAPVPLIAKANSSTQVLLTWSDNSSNETGYRIERQIGSESWVNVGTTGANVTSFTDDGLLCGTSYKYRVSAYNGNGASSYSNEVTSNTSACNSTPYGGIARKIPCKIEAEDYDVGGQMVAYHDLTAGNNMQQYRTDDVDISESPEGGYKVRDWQAGEWLVYTVDTKASTYNINIRIGTVVAGNKINIYLDNVLLTTLTLPNTNNNNNFQTFTVSGIPITEGTNRKLKIESVDGGVYFNWIEFADALEKPLSPSSLRSASNSSSQILLGWTDNSTNESGFKIERQTEQNTWANIGEVGANITRYTDNDLLCAKSYKYRVVAFNDGGLSPYSNESSSTTSACNSSPYGGLVRNIPGKIEAEDYDLGGQNVSYYDLSSGNNGAQYRSEDVDVSECIEGGYKVRDWETGEWLLYTVNTKAAVYDINIRVGTIASDKKVKIYLEGKLLASITLPNTGDYNSYQTVTVSNVLLTDASNKKLKVECVDGGVYFNWIEFVETGKANYIIPPSHLTAAAVSDTSVNISWADSSSNETGFNIERKISGGQWIHIVTADVNVTGFIDKGLTPATTYSYRVSAFNATDTSLYSNEAAVTTPSKPKAPSALTATLVSGNIVKLTWQDNATNEDGFKIMRKTENGISGEIATLKSDSTLYLNTGLTLGTTYIYQVYAYNASGVSGFSNEFTVITPSLPVAPAGLTANVTSGQVNLSWSDLENETGYRIERKTGVAGVWEQLADVASNVVNYANAGLIPGTTYYYRVMAYNLAGNSEYGGEVSVSIPVPLVSPANLVATIVSGTEIRLSWDDLASNEDGYKIEINQGTGYTLKNTVLANIKTVSCTGLISGTTYSFRVYAYKGSEISGYSNELSATTPTLPPAPSDLAVYVADATRVTLKWKDNSSNEDNFVIKRICANQTLNVGVVSANTTTFTDTLGDKSGIKYSYQVYAQNKAGSSSVISKAVVPFNGELPAPSNLTAIYRPATKDIHLEWEIEADYLDTIFIERKTEAGTFEVIEKKFESGFGIYCYFYKKSYNFCNDLGYVPNVNNSYRLRVCYSGKYSPYSEVITQNASNTDINDLKATITKGNQIVLSWSDYKVNTTYYVNRIDASGKLTQLGSVAAEMQYYLVNNCLEGESYHFQLVDVKSPGYVSNIVTLNYSDNGVPMAPKLVDCVYVNVPEIGFLWRDNSDNEDGFVIEFSEDSENYQVFANIPANTTRYSIPNTLEKYKVYYFRIKSYNSSGASFSRTLLINPREEVFVTPVPSNFNFKVTAPYGVKFTWDYDLHTPFTHFHIERRVETGAFEYIGETKNHYFFANEFGSDVSYRIRADISSDGKNLSQYSPELAPVYLSSGPTGTFQNAYAKAISSNQIQLFWEWTSNSTEGFKIIRGGYRNGVEVELATLDKFQRTYIDNSAIPGNEYYYLIKPYNIAGFNFGIDAYANLPGSAPVAPSNLTSSLVSCTQINLQWIDNSGNEAGYLLERSMNSGAFTTVATLLPNVSSYNDMNLTPGATYVYRVKAYNVAGNSAYVETTRATPAIPGVPASLVATANSNTQLNLSWTDNSSNEENFRIEQKTGTGAYSEIATTGANVNSYANTGLTSGTTYGYKVRAYAYGCYSNYSNEVVTTPILVPSGVAAQTISATQINLSWTDNVTNEDGFKIERKTGTDAFVEIALLPANTTSYSNMALQPGVNYSYRIRAYNAGGNSAYSGEIVSKTFLATPANLIATVVDDKQINLSWTDNAANEEGYKIERKTGSGAYTEVATVAANVTSYSNTGLSPKTTYLFRVKASSASNTSEYSNEVNATTLSVPAAPYLHAGPSNPTSISISWKDNADNETGFILECKNDDGTFAEIARLSANVTSYTHSGLVRQKNYTYRLSAYNAVGRSPYSAEVVTSIPLPPTPPTDLVAKVLSGNDILLTWTDNSSDEMFFVIYVNGSLDYFTQKNITTYTITGLPEDIYRISVGAFTSVYQDRGEAVVVNLNPIPKAPSNLGSVLSGNQVTLSWTDNSTDEKGFSIERSSDNGAFNEIATVAAGVTTYKTLPLSNGKEYRFRVRALNTGVASEASNEMVVNLKLNTQVLEASNDYNYVQTIVYGDNETIIGQGVSYSDDFGKAIQSLSQNITGGKIIGSQVLYDIQGRPAIATLPAAFSASDLKYVAGFVTNPNNTAYNYGNFDKTGGPDAMSGKLAEYYSSTNTEEPYVPASAYPYTRTNYSTITGEARKSALAGEAHALGSGHETQGYTMPAPQSELSTFATSTSAGFGNITNASLKYKGIVKTISVDADGKTGIVYSTSNGQTVAACYVDETAEAKTYSAPVDPDFGYYDIHITSDNSLVTVNNSVSFTVYNLGDDQKVGSAYTGTATLNKGFYRIVCSGIVPSSTTITYPVKYKGYSFSLYNEADMLIYTVSPKSYLEWVGETSKTVENFAAKYASYNQYNSLGQVISTQSPDEGISTIIYRNDGQVRFSQNAVQKAEGKFSYTHYDQYGRACESGEYWPDGDNPIDFSDNAEINSIIENIYSYEDGTSDGLADANCHARTITYYDIPEATEVLPNSQQNYTYGGVSKVSNENSTVWYSYTYDGKSEWMIQSLPEIGKKKIEYEYDFNGNVTQVTYQKDKKDQFVHRYEYDADNRLEYVYAQSNTDLVPKLQAHYLYYRHGPLKRVELAGNLQGIDYVYTINGWLKGINDPNLGGDDPGKDGYTGANASFSKDVFGMNLDYFTNDYTHTGTNINSIPGTSCYNGNIAANRWATLKTDNSLQTGAYQYAYNNRNWLSTATFGTINSSNQFVKDPNDKYREHVTYDVNGNIMSFFRDPTAYHQNIDNTYAPNSNKLVSTRSQVLDQEDYKYNAIGQPSEIFYTDRSVPGGTTRKRFFIYDVYGHVTGIKDADGKLLTSYTYNAQGFRIMKTNYGYTEGVTSSSTWYVVDASGNILATYNYEHEIADVYLYGTTRFGVAQADHYGDIRSYAYEITDHLGNVRAVITTDGPDDDTQADLLNYTDYYPFGMEMPGRYISKESRFGYQGQYAEKDPETGYNHFEARDYDSRIGRWLVPDPAGQHWSPYLGMGNNPVSGVDKDGKKDVLFDSGTGNFKSVEHDNFFHNLLFGTRGFTVDVDGNKLSQFGFNDDADVARFLLPTKDAGFLKGITQLPMGVDAMVEIGTAPADKLSLVNKYKYIYNESLPGGNLDFLTHGISSDRLSIIGSYAYNNNDAGNFLWGNALSKMNVPLTMVKLSSEYNGFWNGKLQNGKWNSSMSNFRRITWLGDSKEDQWAIKKGYYYPGYPPQH